MADLVVPHMLICYDASGNVVATIDYMVLRDPETGQIGLADFAKHEAAGGKLRDFGVSTKAVGSGTWPEFLGDAANDFRVELEGKRIVRLVHHRSKYVRHRDKVEAAILSAHEAAIGKIRKEAKLRPDFDLMVERPVVDLRPIVGGPNQPLELDENGRTRPKREAEGALPVHSATEMVTDHRQPEDAST